MSVCQSPEICKKHNVPFLNYCGFWKCPKCNWIQGMQTHETLALCKHNKPFKFGCTECCVEDTKEETITIKKSLWDEMLSYKERIEKLENRIEALTHLFKQGYERIEKLESVISSSQQKDVI